ncbi:MAG: 1,4-dihydroxy-2-naphthoate polyprenyltransferase [Rhodocyclaceae bacterium]|nr:1,4-dihydroxy-2-naphthoate polyprenyltransferase [Rhodocyclaceae bacterium]
MKPEPLHRLGATRPSGWRLWWTAARPRTLTIAATPVLLGCALARTGGTQLDWLLALATLACALAIQAGTNLHNDAADFVRGNDRAERIGPLRVTAAGWARPEQVRRAALAAYSLALALGLLLVFSGGWPILVLGLASLAAGWAYSGGPKPISHSALGELFVLLFFGVAAVAGSHYLQSGQVSPIALLAGIALGAMGAAVLLVNNVRDRDEDSAAGRRTLAARLGPGGARRAYAALMLLPFLVPLLLAAAGALPPGGLAALLALPLAVQLTIRMRNADGIALNSVLARTALTQFLFGLSLAVGISL